MKKIADIFNNVSFQRACLVSMMALATVGLLSGIWLASQGELSSLAGIMGGGLSMGLAAQNWRKLDRREPA